MPDPISAAGGGGAVDLAAKEAPPLCLCHNQPQKRRHDRVGWRCAVKQRAYDAAYDERNPTRRRDRYDRLKAAGLCVICGKDVAVTETRCFDCARANDEHGLTRLG